MSWPKDRIYDATDTGPLPHTTVNALQDAVVNSSHGELEVVVGASSFATMNGAAYFTDIANGPIESVELTATGDVAQYGFDLPTGTIVTSVTVYAHTGSLTPSDLTIRAATSAAIVETTTATVVGVASNTVVLNIPSPFTMGTGGYISIRRLSGVAYVTGLEYTYYKP